MAKRKMILDLDTGVDDALAIAYALADPEVDLIGIVSSYGNNLLDVCAENSLKLLELQVTLIFQYLRVFHIHALLATLM